MGLFDSTAELESAIRATGGRVFTAPYDLTFYGVRVIAGTDAWDDALGVLYTDEHGVRQRRQWPATTTPGIRALRERKNPAGVAVLRPGWHPGLWARGTHHPGRPDAYPCLVTTRDAEVLRDADRDSAVDPGPRIYTAQAIQVHHANDTRGPVSNWSEGCQVLVHAADLRTLLGLLDEQAKRGHGFTLSYTLLIDGSPGAASQGSSSQ